MISLGENVRGFFNLISIQGEDVIVNDNNYAIIITIQNLSPHLYSAAHHRCMGVVHQWDGEIYFRSSLTSP
jgi:hypothetical protein